jgi:heme a synthase
MYTRLIFTALCLTLVVVVVGAYVRLQDAGLGCPDWPGCYGQLLGVPSDVHEVARAEQAFPDRPVETHKAWKEMFHRYIAGALGMLIFAIMIVAWRRRRALAQSPFLATALVVLVAFQAALGMWTVTMLLKPVIVTLHLLGGMAVLGLLSWLAVRQMTFPPAPAGALRLRPWAAAGLMIVIMQIALGGWVSANYAALACQDFPACRGMWLPEMDFRHAFQVVRELGMTSAGTPLAIEALTAIHWMHRLGALITFLYLAGLAVALLRVPPLRMIGTVLAVLLIVQISLGIANVVLRLPLAIAVAHNGGAALLLVTLVVINFALSRHSNNA